MLRYFESLADKYKDSASVAYISERIMSEKALDDLKPEVLMITHIGVGDQIILNGLIRHIACRHKKIYLLCTNSAERFMRGLYADLNGRVEIVPFNPGADSKEAAKIMSGIGFDYARHGIKAHRIGYWSTEEEVNKMRVAADGDFARAFYIQARIPPEVRYDWFWSPLPCNTRSETIAMQLRAHYGEGDGNGYIVRHHDPGRKMAIHLETGVIIIDTCDLEEIIGPHTLIDLIPLLQGARELHLLESCIALFVDALWVTQGIKFPTPMHVYPKNGVDGALVFPVLYRIPHKWHPFGGD